MSNGNGNGAVRLSDRIPDPTQLTSLLGQVRTELGKVEVPGLPVNEIARLTSDFQIQLPDPSTWSQILVPDVANLMTGFPDAASLAGPLNEPLQKILEVASFDFSAEVTRLQNELIKLEAPSLDDAGQFFNDLVSPITDMNQLIRESQFLKLLEAVGKLLGLDGIASLPDNLTSLLAFVQKQVREKFSNIALAFTAVLGAATLVDQIERLIQNNAGQFSLPDTQARFQLVLDAYGEGATGLAAQVAGLDFENPDQVATVKARIEALRQAYEAFLSHLVQDLGFSEASLSLLDMEALQPRFESIENVLSSVDIGLLGELAGRLQDLLNHFKEGLKFDSDLSIDRFRSLVDTGLADLRSELEKVDLTKLELGFQTFFQTITEPLKKFEEYKAEVEAAVRDAYQTIHDAIQQVDLSVIRRGFDQAVSQVGNKLADLDQQVTAVRTAIENSLGQVKGALESVKQFILDPENGLKKQIEDVFQTLFHLLDQLHIQDVVGQISLVLDPISTELQKIEFAPVINATVDAIDVIAEILKTVAPLLVTDSLREKLADTTAFLRQIDLRQVRDTLLEAFQEILDAVDQEALGKFEAEYQKVIEAVDQLDPSPALQELQNEVFDPLIEELEKVKPAELLQGLQEAYDTAAGALNDFDPAASLAFLTDFFNELLDKFHQISPDELLAPVENALSEVRTTLSSFLRIDDALNLLNEVKGIFFPFIESANVGQLFDGIDGAIEAMKAALNEFDLEPLIKIAAVALRDLFSTTGIDLDPAGAAGLLAGIRSGGAGLQERFTRLQQILQDSQHQLEQLDLRAMLLTLRSRHTALMGLLQAGPVDLPAHLELILDLEPLDPMVSLSPLISKAGRLQTSLAQAGEEFGRLISGLGTTFQAVDAAVAALSKFLSPAELLEELLLEPVRRLFPGQTFPGVRELLFHYLDEINPKQWRGALEPLLQDVQTKLKDLFGSTLLDPLTNTLNAIKEAIEGLNITPLREAITAIQADVEAVIQQVNPAPLIQELSDLYQRILDLLEKLNPAEFITSIQKLYTDDVIGIVKAISPQELLLPVLQELFQKIEDLLVSFDIQVIFEPVLTQLRLLKDQLADGLEEAAEAYDRMLAAIPTSGESVSASAEVSMGVPA